MIFVILYQCQWTNAKDSAWRWAFESKWVEIMFGADIRLVKETALNGQCELWRQCKDNTKIPQRQQEDQWKTTQRQHEDKQKIRGRQEDENTNTARRQEEDNTKTTKRQEKEDNWKTSCYLGRIAAPATSPSFTNCSVFLATCANEHGSCNQSTMSETSKTTIEQFTMWWSINQQYMRLT